MEGVETVTESRHNGRSKGEPPRTTVAKLLEDVTQILEESLPAFEASLEATDHELPASITVKVAFVPAKAGTDSSPGRLAKIIVGGKLALPTTGHEHDVSTGGGQLALF